MSKETGNTVTNEQAESNAARRAERLRSFMRRHDICSVDIAEQLAPVLGRHLSPVSVYTLLFRNVWMERSVRETLLALGFPKNTLQPLRKRRQPRFPGLKNNPQATA